MSHSVPMKRVFMLRLQLHFTSFEFYWNLIWELPQQHKAYRQTHTRVIWYKNAHSTHCYASTSYLSMSRVANKSLYNGFFVVVARINIRMEKSRLLYHHYFDYKDRVVLQAEMGRWREEEFRIMIALYNNTMWFSPQNTIHPSPIYFITSRTPIPHIFIEWNSQKLWLFEMEPPKNIFQRTRYLII
jgi:hypothetical protein